MHSDRDDGFPTEAGSTEADGSDELYERHVMTVDRGQESVRIDKFLTHRLTNVSRNRLQQAITAQMVLVNGKPVKSNYRIRPGDGIVVFSDNAPETYEVKPEPLPLRIVYEDDYIMLIDKDAGMVVHPGHGNYSGTLVNGVAWHLRQERPEVTEDALPRYGLVHRIDKNTSGLLVVAKTDKAAVALAGQFFEHTVHRRYIALVWGEPEADTGTVTGHIGRHLRFRKLMDVFPEGDHGKEAITHYTVLERLRYVSLLECRLETGRTHQIRVHMQHIGHPLFNDEVYGGDRIVKGTVFTRYRQFVENCFAICPRHALHARSLGFVHPTTGEQMTFESPLPKDMSDLIEKWRHYVKFRREDPE